MNPYAIEVQIEKPYRAQQEVQSEEMQRAAEATLQHGRVEEACDLTVRVTGDETVRELNRRHRGVDAPTDVLAFPSEAEGLFVDAPGLPRYLGDVIISLPRAKAHAAEAGNTLSAELQLLVVHGVLHLLGHTDETAPERARMWRAQQTVLDDLGLEVHLPD